MLSRCAPPSPEPWGYCAAEFGGGGAYKGAEQHAFGGVSDALRARCTRGAGSGVVL